MCWTMTIGSGKAAGSALKIAFRAAGPPVDEPIASSERVR